MTLPPAASDQDVCAVIVTWNPDDGFAGRAAAACSQVEGMMIIDNASRADRAAVLAAACALDSTACVINPANLGIASALNLGLAHAEAAGYRRALLLDQDSEIGAELMPALRQQWQVWPHPEQIAVLGAAFTDSRRQNGAGPESTRKEDGCEPVDWVITSGSLVSVAHWRRLGGFREDFFIDFVDTEYGQRANRAGYAVLRTRRILMRHTIGKHQTHRLFGRTAWSNHHSADRRYYMTRNFIALLRESGRYPLGTWFPRGVWASLKSVRRIVLYEENKRDKLTAIAQGWLDGLLGRMGPRRKPRLARAEARRRA